MSEENMVSIEIEEIKHHGDFISSQKSIKIQGKTMLECLQTFNLINETVLIKEEKK